MRLPYLSLLFCPSLLAELHRLKLLLGKRGPSLVCFVSPESCCDSSLPVAALPRDTPLEKTKSLFVWPSVPAFLSLASSCT